MYVEHEKEVYIRVKHILREHICVKDQRMLYSFKVHTRWTLVYVLPIGMVLLRPANIYKYIERVKCVSRTHIDTVGGGDQAIGAKNMYSVLQLEHFGLHDKVQITIYIFIYTSFWIDRNGFVCRNAMWMMYMEQASRAFRLSIYMAIMYIYIYMCSFR